VQKKKYWSHTGVSRATLSRTPEIHVAKRMAGDMVNPILGALFIDRPLQLKTRGCGNKMFFFNFPFIHPEEMTLSQLFFASRVLMTSCDYDSAMITEYREVEQMLATEINAVNASIGTTKGDLSYKIHNVLGDEIFAHPASLAGEEPYVACKASYYAVDFVDDYTVDYVDDESDTHIDNVKRKCVPIWYENGKLFMSHDVVSGKQNIEENESKNQLGYEVPFDKIYIQREYGNTGDDPETYIRLDVWMSQLRSK